MAVKKRPDADRLPVSQRIDSRMDNPKRRQMSPTDWKIKGELFLNCSCEVFCPCVVSLGAHPPTEGHCNAWMAIAIDEGHYEGEDLSGLNVGLMVEIPGRMAEGGWKVAAYVDERASGKAYNGILQIFSGAAGGTTGLFTMLVSDIVNASSRRAVSNPRSATLAASGILAASLQKSVRSTGAVPKNEPDHAGVLPDDGAL